MKIQVNQFEFDTGLTGVLGPQGVGKTTLLKQIAATDTATEQEAEGKLCYASRELEPFHSLTVKEFLCYKAGQFDVLAEDVSLTIEAALHQAHLHRVTNLRIADLNPLLQSQTLLAKVLIQRPKLLLLDEVFQQLADEERMHIGYSLSSLAKDRVVVYAGRTNETLEGLFDHVCLLHPNKQSVQVATNTAYEWVEGKVWEYFVPNVSHQAHGIVSACKQHEEGVLIREISDKAPFVDEVSQVTPTLHDAYLWWAQQ